MYDGQQMRNIGIIWAFGEKGEQTTRFADILDLYEDLPGYLKTVMMETHYQNLTLLMIQELSVFLWRNTCHE